MVSRNMLERLFGSRQKKKHAFTLIEILVSVGIISILAGVTIQALAPRKTFLGATDTGRIHTARHIENSMYQFLIQEWTLPNESQIPEGEANAKQICAQGVVNSTCANIDPLIAPEFIAYVPREDMEPCALYAGFKTYKLAGRPRVIPRFLGKLPGDNFDAEPCGNPGPPEVVPVSVIDNTDSNYSEGGDWADNNGVGYKKNYKKGADENSAHAEWDFFSVGEPLNGTYRVYATWVASSGAATMVTYEIYDNNTLLGSVVRDHSVAPNDAQYNGSLFSDLGEYTFTAHPRIKLIVEAGQEAYADAIIITEP